jgi:hypothetical protein
MLQNHTVLELLWFPQGPAFLVPGSDRHLL